MPPFPAPFRAVVGLVATVIDEAKHFPDKAIELPMLAVSSALQASLRAQQRYARLTARGDEVLSGRSTSDEAPDWATFDDPIPQGTNGRSTRSGKSVRGPRSTRPSAFDAVEDE